MSRIYREADEHTRPPVYCPACQQVVDQAWINAGISGDPDRWVSGRWRCVTPGCAYALGHPTDPAGTEPAATEGEK